MIATLCQLFASYLKIGFFGFGGGYAMLSLIQNEVVVQHAWLSEAQFADIVAVSQMTPGPIAINSATYVGLITRFFMSLHDNRYVKGIVGGMQPVVIGMIGAAALLLIFPSSDDARSFIDAWSWILFALTLLGSLRKVNPILLILLSAAAGILIYGVF